MSTNPPAKPGQPTQKRRLVFLLTLLGSAAAYVLLIFLPGQRATAQLRRELTDQQLYVQNAGELDSQIARVEGALKRTKEFIDHWHQVAPNEERLSQVFLKITQFAEKSEASIMKFEPQPAEKLHYLQRVPLEMALEGKFAQVFEFVAQVESLETDLWVESMTITPVLATPGRVRCELKLAIFAGEREISD